MPSPIPRLNDTLTSGFAAIRREAGIVEEFSTEALTLASERAAEPPVPGGDAYRDRTDIELISIDPEGSQDLDQALHIERRGSGYRFHYAIADVGHWVEPGDPIDRAARERGTTIYSPDKRIPLHPTDLSEGAASLFADVIRPSLLWTIDLDQRGDIADINVERAIVRNRSTLSYAEVQSAMDAGSNDRLYRLIEEVGHLRLDLEVARGGISLELPEQSVELVDGHYELRYEAPREVEAWNAQLSLLCGMSAAQVMLKSGVGILRTLPPADDETIEELRRHSAALKVPWPESLTYAQWVRSLDANTAIGGALMNLAARTLRGSGYLAFDNDLPAEHKHNAIAADYAHVTAPLRRLVDRFGNECVLAAAQGKRPPTWTLEALPELAKIMGAASSRASKVDRAAVDLAEVAVLHHRVGDTFVVSVTASNGRFSRIQLADPAVIASVETELEIGTTCTVRLEEADLAGPTLHFSLVK